MVMAVLAVVAAAATVVVVVAAALVFVVVVAVFAVVRGGGWRVWGGVVSEGRIILKWESRLQGFLPSRCEQHGNPRHLPA